MKRISEGLGVGGVINNLFKLWVIIQIHYFGSWKDVAYLKSTRISGFLREKWRLSPREFSLRHWHHWQAKNFLILLLLYYYYSSCMIFNWYFIINSFKFRPNPSRVFNSDCICVEWLRVSENLNWTARRKDFSGKESAGKAKAKYGFSRFSAWELPKRKPQAFPKRKGPFRVHSYLEWPLQSPMVSCVQCRSDGMMRSCGEDVRKKIIAVIDVCKGCSNALSSCRLVFLSY